LQIAGHRLQSGTAVGDFHVKEISKNTITLEAADGFQPKPFPGFNDPMCLRKPFAASPLLVRVAPFVIFLALTFCQGQFGEARATGFIWPKPWSACG
jgi:hypothetical protein